jgi:two-component system, OmpR family, KDP operon response regulator KdpE
MTGHLKKKILIVDDETSVSRFVRHSLEANDFKVVEAQNGRDGIQRVIEDRPELILLDFGLPDMTGIEVLKRVREWSKTPVIFLTVRDSEQDKVAALDSGADDYLTKPFGVSELLARIRVAFRHNQPQQETDIFKMGPLEVDRSGHIIRVGGNEVKLTATEYALLLVLVNHLGKIVPHRTILSDVWGPNSLEHKHYLRVYFGQIRKKFDSVLGGSSELIQSESGIGYRLKELV